MTARPETISASRRRWQWRPLVRAGRGVLARLPADAWAVLALSLAATLSRLYANPLYAGEPSSDEYFYGLYAIEIARALARGDVSAAAELSVETRIIGLEVGALLSVLPLDPISLGRLVQALFNALTVPLVYALARTLSLRPSASLAAAVLLLALPELWESAWRYWADSQAVFLTIATLLVGLRAVERPGWLTVLPPVVLLTVTFLTKEFVGAAMLPALGAIVLLALGGRLLSRPVHPVNLATVAAAVLLFAVALVAAQFGSVVVEIIKTTAPDGPILRTVLSAERLLGSIATSAGRLGDYLRALDQQFGPDRFGTGLVVFWALGGVVLFAQGVRAAAGWRLAGMARWEVLAWLLAAAAWLPSLLLGWVLAWQATSTSPAWQALLVGAALLLGPGRLWLERTGLVDPSTSELVLGTRSARVALALTVLGLLELTFLLLRLVIWAAPDLRAAFTPRSFLPAFPGLALIAGVGLAELARLVLVPLPERCRSMGVPVALGALLLATLVWLAPTHEHLAGELLLGRRADRQGDPSTPEGLRIASLVEAEAWLQANLLPTDRVMTSMPRHVAWYARTGLEGYASGITMGDLATTWPERYQKIVALLERPSEVDYIIDYNVHWRDPTSTEATFWYALYEWLQTRPYLEEVYSRRDPNGRVVFYVFRNHRWATAPTHLERRDGLASG